MNPRTLLIATAPLSAALLLSSTSLAQPERERQPPHRPDTQRDRDWQDGDRDWRDGQRDGQQMRDGQKNYVLASETRRTNVVNRQGENLGDISNLIIDVREGKTPYAVVSFGGILGMGRDSVAVPVQAFSWDEREERYILDTTRERLESAPDFDEDNWNQLYDQTWREQTRRAFGQIPEMDRDRDQQRDGMRPGQGRPGDARPGGTRPGQPGDRPGQRDGDRPGQPGQPGGERPGQPGQPGGIDRPGQPGAQADRFERFMLLTNMTNSNIVGSDGDRISSINDVIIDRRTGHVGFVTIDTGGVIGMGTTTRVIPWEALTRVDEDEFRVSIASGRLQNAPELDTDRMERLNNEQFRQSIYSFYQVQPRDRDRDRDGARDRDRRPGQQPGDRPGQRPGDRPGQPGQPN